MPGGFRVNYRKKVFPISMKNLEFRTSNWEVGNAETISGYAVVFEQRTVLYKDPVTGIEYGEIIDRHALDCANMADVVLRYNHQGRVLARTRNHSLQLSIDDHGLNIRADMSGSDEAMSFYKEVKNGLLDKMSFAFQVKEDIYDQQTNTRRILAISCIQDVSLVDFPAYDQTQVSARSKFTEFAEPDRAAYKKAQVAVIHAEMQRRIESMGFHDNETSEDYISPAEYNAKIASFRSGYFQARPDAAEPLKHQILVLRDKIQQKKDSSDIEAAQSLRNLLESLELQLHTALSVKRELRNKIAQGVIGGKILESTEFKKREEHMNTETRAFFEKLTETRAAGTTGTMTAVIPSGVMSEYVVEKAPGAFFMAAKRTAIPHNGNLSLPVATLQAVDKHEENSILPDAGYVPGRVLIEHNEYCYQTGYSDLGMRLGAENLERIISDTIFASMMKKMDGICINAAAALSYEKDINSVEVSAAPTYTDFVTLAGYLGSDFLECAKWYMHPSTYFTWLMGLKDDQNRPILDASKLVSEQAFCGYGIELDSQLPARTVYFGDAGRVHLNYAREPELNAWTDYDQNTQKFSIRAVAGAAAENGSFVKMYTP